ncbi:molybdopterin-dependent oxidoreductase [Thetidibacter halocola]|uniref:Molybdopterin-dependent oxidoreductase n=1 Tax=Thetidibacter halocola TaxID=2827239 RepID=A0A8J8B6Y5_9RHOB|nr:molybdopterin-dependent oxidoreductase [Thetidibacter halocola]MBS0123842.1 molybdopterin-dependent oxidoreductase [Thetidibacter halocola]
MLHALRQIAFWGFLLAGTAAQALEAPQSPTVLTVTGDIAVTNAGDSAVFDRAMLQSLDWREVATHTSFTHGPQRFAGPTLASLLAALGVTEGTLRATAINDYTIEIPVAHAARHDVLLAMDLDGKPMTVRDKGPIWVVYPLTEVEAAGKPFDGEMIWQLVRIEVRR